MILSELRSLILHWLEDQALLQDPRSNLDSERDQPAFKVTGDPPSGRRLFSNLRMSYGDEPDYIQQKLKQLKRLTDRFDQCFGDGPVWILRAPARINILGEHVDYVSYLPTASLTFGSCEHDMLMVFRPSGDSSIRGVSSLQTYPDFCFELSEGPRLGEEGGVELDWASYLFSRPAPVPHWANYTKGAVFFALKKYGRQVQQGFNFLVDSSIPAGGGASSSSTLTVLAGAAIRRVNNLAFSAAELALDSAQAEWFLGTRGGDMDHRTICLSRSQHFVHLSYDEPQDEVIALPRNDFRWVTFFSHAADKGREVMLEYNERAAVSRLLIPAMILDWSVSRPLMYNTWKEAVEGIRQYSEEAFATAEELLSELPQTTSLREVEKRYPSAFDECERAFPALVGERKERPLKVRSRALHHLGEIRRVRAARETLRAMEGFPQKEAIESAMRQLGRLLGKSHKSLRDLYDVCTPEVNRLVEIIDASPATYGARLMGGGFGGNILTLTTREHTGQLIRLVQSEFYSRQGIDGLRDGAIMLSTPGDGLSELTI